MGSLLRNEPDMGALTLFWVSFRLTMGRLCRQLPLLAGLSLLCVLFSVLGGRVAEALLTDGVSFSGLTLAVAAPEGDETPQLIQQYMGNMDDIRSYCEMVAMEEGEAREALSRGTVDAVLLLPEGFIQGVQWGENPPVQIIVKGERPLESLLTLWVGQSAADTLSAAQAGIYAVLDLYDAGQLEGLPREQVVMEINLRYVQWILNRLSVVAEERILPTGALSIREHYMFSLFCWLLLSLAPVFAWNYQGTWPRNYGRLCWIKRGVWAGLAASLTGCAAEIGGLLWLALLLTGEAPLPALVAALCCGFFCAVYTALCGLLTRQTSGCAGLSFLISVASLFLAGGLLPPVLLPDGVRALEGLSPITWMRALAAVGMDPPADIPPALVLVAVSAGLLIPTVFLYRRRCLEGEE